MPCLRNCLNLVPDVTYFDTSNCVWVFSVQDFKQDDCGAAHGVVLRSH
ncbi:MAG: hypothetical protein ACRC14_02605 [Paracoccaceae bacterium]